MISKYHIVGVSKHHVDLRMDKYIEAVSAFSEKFGEFSVSTKEGVAWDGKAASILFSAAVEKVKAAEGLQDQLEENGYWLFLNIDGTVDISDFYTFADDFPKWGVEYVVGYCKLNNLECNYGEEQS